MANIPVIQQTIAGSGSGTLSAATFPGPSTSGNALVIGFGVATTSGGPTSLSLSDNNGNTYTQVASMFIAGKSHLGWSVFVCTNLKASPNSTISITPTAVLSGGAGSLLAWSLGGGEWNNCNTSNAVLTAAQVTGGPSITLTGQPAGTTAVGMSLPSISVNSST